MARSLDDFQGPLDFCGSWSVCKVALKIDVPKSKINHLDTCISLVFGVMWIEEPTLHTHMLK